MGISKEETVLKKNGIYKISRNPTYVGFYLILVTSCIYSPNPLTVIFSLMGILIHHKIVISEENIIVPTQTKYVGTLKNAMLAPAACAIRQPHDKPIETLPVIYTPLLIGGFPEKLPS